jgi:lactate dehydrogenase-like 2-hydroxyacid dehydrogenase
MQPKLFVTRRLPQPVEDRLRAGFEVTFGSDDAPFDQAGLPAQVKDFDAVLLTLTEPLPAQVLAELPPQVKIIATFSVGFDHIDVAAATARGITVVNTPGAVIESTADTAFLLLLASARRAHEGEALVRSGAWTGWRPTQLLGTDVHGKRLGLVGFGGIGRAVARRAQGFRMEVHYFEPQPVKADAELRATYHARLEDLLAISDILSLHCPSTEQTRNLVNARTIELLPQGAVIVNSARGDLVDDEALIAALRSGRVAAAGLDVYRGEPQLDPRYRTLPNVFLLPHLGTATHATRTEMGMIAAANLEAFFAGRPPPNRVT